MRLLFVAVMIKKVCCVSVTHECIQALLIATDVVDADPALSLETKEFIGNHTTEHSFYLRGLFIYIEVEWINYLARMSRETKRGGFQQDQPIRG